MGQLLSFEDHALARLRERVAAAEEAREDLLAFARGQSGLGRVLLVNVRRIAHSSI